MLSPGPLSSQVNLHETEKADVICRIFLLAVTSLCMRSSLYFCLGHQSRKILGVPSLPLFNWLVAPNLITVIALLLLLAFFSF